MTPEDRGPFAELLVGIGETYGEPVSDARMEIYFRALEDLSFAEVNRAANAHVRASKFFPRPAELREAVDGSVDDRAELAWAHVLREVRRVGYTSTPSWPDEQTRRAAMELFGGWLGLCQYLPAEGVGLVTAAKQFKASFAAYTRRDAREAMSLPPSRAEAGALLDNLKAELTKRGLPAAACSARDAGSAPAARATGSALAGPAPSGAALDHDPGTPAAADAEHPALTELRSAVRRCAS